MRDAVKFLIGSAITYAIAAACGSQGSPGAQQRADAGQDASGGEGGQGGTGLPDAAPDAVIDALTDPVDEAEAASGSGAQGGAGGSGGGGPEVIETTCDQVAASGYHYARADYPGVPVRELWNVVALGHVAAGVSVVLPEFPWEHAPVQLADGAAVAMCGNDVRFDTVVFVRGR